MPCIICVAGILPVVIEISYVSYNTIFFQVVDVKSLNMPHNRPYLPSNALVGNIDFKWTRGKPWEWCDSTYPKQFSIVVDESSMY